MYKKTKLKGCAKGCGIIIVIITTIFIISMIFVLLPSSADTHFNKATNLYNNGNYEEAHKENKSAIEKDSLKYDYHYLNAKLFLELKDTVASKKALNKAAKMIKGDSAIFEFNKDLIDWKISKKDTFGIENKLNQLTSTFSTDNFNNFTNTFYFSADRAYELQKRELSSKLLHQLIDSVNTYNMPNLEKTLYAVSQKFFRYKDSLNGVKTLKSIIKNNPDSKSAYKVLGNYYFNKDNNKTIHYLTKYIEIDTTDAPIYRKIAASFLNKKHKKSALKYFRISANKGDREACLSLRELTAKTKYYSRSLCWDGTTSSSTGRGACSHHGGVRRIEYVPYKVYTEECR